MRKSFDEVFEDVTKYGTKVKTDEYHVSGAHIIIDQGQEQIAGYTDLQDGLFTAVPALIFGDHTRVVKYIDKPFFLGADGVKVLRSRFKDANYRYLYYALKNIRVPNTGYNRHFKWLKDSIIEYPDNEEQCSIVTILDKLSNIIDARKAELQQFDNLIKARFVEMFAKYENTSHLVLDDISEMVTVGIANSATHAYSKEGVIMFRNQNIKEGFLDDSDLIYIRKDFANKYKTKALKGNDLLVTRTGYPGIACIVPVKYEGCQTFTTLIVRLKNDANIRPVFVCHYINSSYGKEFVTGNQVGVAQQNFGAKSLAQMPIFLPPVEEQIDFENLIELVDKSKFEVQKALEETQLLFDSLMQKFFS